MKISLQVSETPGATFFDERGKRATQFTVGCSFPTPPSCIYSINTPKKANSKILKKTRGRALKRRRGVSDTHPSLDISHGHTQSLLLQSSSTFFSRSLRFFFSEKQRPRRGNQLRPNR